MHPHLHVVKTTAFFVISSSNHMRRSSERIMGPRGRVHGQGSGTKPPQAERFFCIITGVGQFILKSVFLPNKKFRQTFGGMTWPPLALRVFTSANDQCLLVYVAGVVVSVKTRTWRHTYLTVPSLHRCALNSIYRPSICVLFCFRRLFVATWRVFCWFVFCTEGAMPTFLGRPKPQSKTTFS